MALKTGNQRRSGGLHECQLKKTRHRTMSMSTQTDDEHGLADLLVPLKLSLLLAIGNCWWDTGATCW